jgi:serine/threonine protein phosphatase PrpC
MEDAMHVYAWASSDVGKKRSHNEDCYFLSREWRLFAVADGMGGAHAGEVASALAVRTLERFVDERLPERAQELGSHDDVAALLVSAVSAANHAVRRRSLDDPQCRGMGTTATTLWFVGDEAFVAHVGDSRCYRVRRGQIVQVSCDHSLVEEQVRAGLITKEQARSSPWKNIITRAVGVADNVEVDLVAVDVEDGDVFVVCSDGLSGVVNDDEIAQVVNEGFLHRIPDTLIDLANARGGPDNITVVVACAVAVRWDRPMEVTTQR